MTTRVASYRKLRRSLIRLLEKNLGLSDEAEFLFAQLDELYEDMSVLDRQYLQWTGPTVSVIDEPKVS